MRKLCSRLHQGWDRFWFGPGSALNLAAVRVIVAAHALWLLLSRDLPALSGLPSEFWAHVPDAARWRFLLWEGHPGLEAGLHAVALAALLGAIVGIRPRTCCFVAGLLLYRLAPLEVLFFAPTPWIRGLTISVPALIVLSLSPCGDALSVGGNRRTPAERAPASEYNWPLRLIQLLLCQVYLFGGYAKIYRVGWSWASAENIRQWLLLENQGVNARMFGGLGPWLAERPTLCLLAGVGTLALDFGFILALFSKRARLWLVPAALGLHVGIVFSLNYAFLNTPQLLMFVDWDALGSRKRRAHEGPHTEAGGRSSPALQAG